MQRTLIKICGVTRPDDAQAIAELDVDVIGLNFVPCSPRCVTAGLAKELIGAIGGRVQVWGVFVNTTVVEVNTLLEQIRFDALQWHGDETPEFCGSFNVPYVKVLRMRDGIDVDELAAHYHDARMLLLDSFVVGQAGGTGTRFDWNRWPRACALPLMLAGGLDADNVKNAVQVLRPAGVDVCGGVEGQRKGLKDLEKCKRFVDAVRTAD